MSLIYPKNETARLQVLSEYKILDTVPEKAFDGITNLAKKICAIPMVGISFIDRRREWFKSKIGIEFSEIPRGISLSAYALYDTSPLVIYDTRIDKRFSSNPLVTSSPHTRFYSGIPLVVKNAYVLGTLHVMDQVPRKLKNFHMEALCSLALQVIEFLELRRRLALVEKYYEERQRYERQLEETNAKLEVLAITDELTGLRNRRAFEGYLNQEVSRAHRYKRPLSLMLIDIDQFKKYNDIFGHPAGDELLKDVAILFNKCTRASDSVFRIGGDEFAVILSDTRRSAAKKLAERVRKRVEKNLGRHSAVTISIGIGDLDFSNTGTTTLMAETDKALYRAKQDGRNRACHVHEL